MEVLFHFIFEICKIAILGLFYATLLLLVCRIIALFKPDSLVERLSKEKSTFWSISYFGSGTLLFLFMFSYWGNHGLGDSYQMPIGHWKVVKGTNSPAYPYIQNEYGEQLGLGEFVVAGGKLWGETTSGGYNANVDGYVVWDLRTDAWKTYEDWTALQKENGNAPADRKSFRTYEDYYREHWNGWRFWLLP